MGIIDIIILIIIALAIFKGLKDGFVKQAGAIIGLIAGVILASRFSSILAIRLHQWIEVSENIVKIISFIIILIGVCIGMGFLGKLFEKLLKAITLGWLNKLLGVILSVFTATLIIGLLISLINYVNASWFTIVPPAELSKSKGVELIEPLTNSIFPYLKGFFNI